VVQSYSQNYAADAAPQVKDYDYVLVSTDRPEGPFSLETAQDKSLTVVSLPSHEGETLSLSAGNALVLVPDLDVGYGEGVLNLSAAHNMAIGGHLTAGLLNLDAGGDVSLKTQVGTMNIELRDGADLQIEQGAAGVASADLVIDTLVMSGGTVDIVADGNVIINSVTGILGQLNITSTGGNVWVRSMADGGDVRIEATGAVVLGSRAAASGPADTTIEADTLSVKAGAEITVFEADGVDINQIWSTSQSPITVLAGGDLALNADISTSGHAIDLRTSVGALTLNGVLSTGGGSVSL